MQEKHRILKLAWTVFGYTTFAVVCGLGSTAAWAQNEPITARDYDVEIPVSLVMGDHRIIGLGGAYTSIAEGSASSDFNPASFAIRHPYSVDEVDWDWHLDWLIIGVGQEIDLENNGVTEIEFDEMSMARLGFNVQINDFGFGLGGSVTKYIVPASDGRKLEIATSTVVLGFGWSILDGDLALGINLMGASLNVKPDGDKKNEVKYLGGTLSAGIVYRGENRPWRVGATVTSPIGFTQKDSNKDEAFGLILPRQVNYPLRVALGFSYFWSFGDRKYNQRFNPKAKPANDRRYLLLSTDLIVDGPTTDRGTGVEGFVMQELDPAGNDITLSLRLGLESEVWNNRLKLRAGTYLEPSRFQDEPFRVHGTGGLELRMFRLWGWDWRIATTVDMARDYQNLLIGVGFWH